MQTSHDFEPDDSASGWLARFTSIGKQLKAARKMLDLREQIIAHPWYAVGGALLFGAWVGLEAPKSSPDEPGVHSRIAGALVTTAGAIAMRVVREIALRQATAGVKQWYDSSVAAHEAEAGGAPTSSPRTRH